jgi:two-component system, response regulator PdtaR
MTAPATSVRVLVADDDPEARELLVSTLRSLGHEVIGEVGTGRDAVLHAQSLQPEAILLDVHMPDGSGIDAAKQIAAALPGVAVVLFTGDETLSLSEQDVAESSAISMLTKPAKKSTLDSALRLAVANARRLTAARQELQNRKDIERAKGILQRRTGCTEQDAYRILQRSSQDRSIPMVTVAREVLKSEPGASAH